MDHDDAAVSNPSDNRSLAEILDRRLSRRGFVGGGLIGT
jgi:secreted PhoX family phosphatase